MSENLGMDAPLRWEDGNYYDLPQDYADMHGWEELSRKVSDYYHALPEEIKDKCMIYGGSYGHACSMSYFKEKYNLPEVYSFSSSCLMWLDPNVDFEYQIMVDEVKTLESSWFNTIEVVDSITNGNARDPGYIHFRSNPKGNVSERWTEVVLEGKSEFNFQ